MEAVSPNTKSLDSESLKIKQKQHQTHFDSKKTPALGLLSGVPMTGLKLNVAPDLPLAEATLSSGRPLGP